METVVEAPKSKRKAWYQIKIDELEASIAELKAANLVAAQPKERPLEGTEGIHFESFAEGYVACLTKYAILPKEKRRIIKLNLISQGPKYVGQSAWTRMKF